MYFCVNFGVCDTSDDSIAALAPVAVAARRSPASSTAPTCPSRRRKGYVARLDFEHASAFTLSDYRYNRFVLRRRGVRPQERHAERLLGAHARGGFVRAISTGHGQRRAASAKALLRRRRQLGARIRREPAGSAHSHDRRLDACSTRRRASPGGTCAPNARAVRFCDPNSPKPSQLRLHARSRSGERRCSRGASSTAFRCRSARRSGISSARCSSTAASSDRVSIRGLADDQRASCKGTGAVTPGFGIRYESPVGPIRVDIGINPNRSRSSAW